MRPFNRLSSSSSLSALAAEAKALRSKSTTKWAAKYVKESKKQFLSVSANDLSLEMDESPLLSLCNSHLSFNLNSDATALTNEKNTIDSSNPIEKTTSEEAENAFQLPEIKKKASQHNEPVTLIRPLYKKEWRRNNRCDFCGRPDGDLQCELCNVIAHSICYMQWHRQRQAKQRPKSTIRPNKDSLSVFGLPKDEFIDSVDELVEYYSAATLNDFFNNFYIEEICFKDGQKHESVPSNPYKRKPSVRKERNENYLKERRKGQILTGRRETVERDNLKEEEPNDEPVVWFCRSCQKDLITEYNRRVVEQREESVRRNQVTSIKVIQAFFAMKRMRQKFLTGKHVIVLLQARIRGYLTRKHNVEKQKSKIRPCRVLVDIVQDFTLENNSYLTSGWGCSPFIVITVFDESELTQRFSFETSIKKMVGNPSLVAWNEEFFLPGVNGRSLIVFTLLSKNGQNNYFLGQTAIATKMFNFLRTSPIPLKLEIEDLKYIPRVNQNYNYVISTETGEYTNHFAQSHLRVQIQWFSESNSLCGYLTPYTILPQNDAKTSKSTSLASSESVDGSTSSLSGKGKNHMYTVRQNRHSRWCVLCDDYFRVYRLYGLTIPYMEIPLCNVFSIHLMPARQYQTLVTCICINYLNEEMLWKCESTGNANGNANSIANAIGNSNTNTNDNNNKNNNAEKIWIGRLTHAVAHSKKKKEHIKEERK